MEKKTPKALQSVKDFIEGKKKPVEFNHLTDREIRKVLKKRSASEIEKFKPDINLKRIDAVKKTREAKNLFKTRAENLGKVQEEWKNINSKKLEVRKYLDSSQSFRDGKKERAKMFSTLEQLSIKEKDLSSKIEAIITKGKGAFAEGVKVDDKFIKWPRNSPYSPDSEFLNNRFFIESDLADKGISPEIMRVKTSKKENLIQDHLDQLPNTVRDQEILTGKVNSETIYDPIDIRDANIGFDHESGNSKILDAGQFKDPSPSNRSKKEIRKELLSRHLKAIPKNITKKTAGTIRRKLPSVLPFVGPIVLGASLLTSKDANARNEVMTDFIDPSGSDVIGGGDLPKNELVKRSNFNRAMKLQNMREENNEYRNDQPDSKPLSESTGNLF